jgi:S1-C subfamily serine protease
MRQVLDLHRKAEAGRPVPVAPRIPEDIPTMSPMIAKRKDSKCIHCHDVKVAELKHAQQLGRFTRHMVHTYPAPSAVGIHLHPDVQNLISAVASNSPAHLAGIRGGDTVLAAKDQGVLTFGDFTRILETIPAEGTLPLQIKRGNQTLRPALKLSGNWRRTEDPSWRESLHVAGPNGGFWGHKLSDDERAKHNAPTNGMAVLVTFIWGDHTKRAGIKVNDVVIKFDGLTHDMTLPQLHAHLNLDRSYGDTIPLTVRRNRKDHDLTLALPKDPSPND